MITSVTIVVPARDEELEISGCLNSLESAQQHLVETTGGRVSSHVVVVLDRCDDRTAELVARHPDVTAVVCSAGNVGAARRLGASTVPADACQWLASTDADCRVPPDWLTVMLAHADAGVDLIVGSVLPAAGLAEHVRAAWFALHDDADGHPHVHGANLGIRADLYQQIGGWTELAEHEDVDLVRRAVNQQRATVLRSGEIPVTTSSRSVGRVGAGFAGYLRDLAASVSPESHISDGTSADRAAQSLGLELS